LFKDTSMPFLTSMVIFDMYVVQNRRSPHLFCSVGAFSFCLSTESHTPSLCQVDFNM
jgi:hypothetical protein